MLSTLEKFGLTAIDSVGQPFDPNQHEALSMGSSEEVPPNCVITEYAKGYMFKDRLLRPAKVIVCQKNG